MTTIADAVQAAADSLRAAAREQQDAEPDHADFCALALACEQVLDALFALNSNIGIQLAHYGEGREHTGTGRAPAQVIGKAMNHGRALDLALRQGRQSAHALAGECAQFATGPL